MRTAEQLTHDWNTDPRWQDVQRPYLAEEVVRLRGSVAIAHTLAARGAARLWESLHSTPYVHALGAMTGTQAVQMVAAGLQAIYVSGWQVAADANDALSTYPDQSLYPADSAPNLVRRINNATAPPTSSGASTTRCCAPTKSTRWRASTRPIGWCRWWPMPRQVSAGC